MKVCEVEWSVRTTNCFKNTGFWYDPIDVLYDVAVNTPEILHNMRNVGRKTITEIICKIEDIKKAEKSEEKEIVIKVDGWSTNRIIIDIRNEKAND